MSKKIKFKDFTDSELIVTYKKLGKIISVEKDEHIVVEKVLAKLPKPIIDHVNSDRENNTNPFHLAGLYGDLTQEMANRFIKSHL